MSDPTNLLLSSRLLKVPQSGCVTRCSLPLDPIGSREGTVYVWNFQNPEKPILFAGHTDYVESLAFSPDGKQLVSGGRDNTTRLWEVEAAEQIATLPLDEPRVTMDIAFSPCGKIIAGGTTKRLWCAEHWLRTIPQPEDNHRTYALAFSPCGKYRIWHLVAGRNGENGNPFMGYRHR